MLPVGQPGEQPGVSPALPGGSDGSMGSQLDATPNFSFLLGFLKLIAHPTALRIPFSGHYTTWLCTEM